MLNRIEKINYLKQYRASLNRMLSLRAEHSEWLTIGLGVSQSTDTPVKSSAANAPSKPALAAERRDALLGEIESELILCRTQRAEIVALIDSIDDESEQTVLRLVYVNGYAWDVVAAMMGYSTRQARRLHNVAIDNLYIEL